MGEGDGLWKLRIAPRKSPPEPYHGREFQYLAPLGSYLKSFEHVAVLTRTENVMTFFASPDFRTLADPRVSVSSTVHV